MTAARIDELRAKFEDNPRRYFAPLANEYRKAGDLVQAIALCREFLPNQPGHMSGHIVYGQALFETGELDEARDVFETALELDPENLIALRHLGDIAKARGDLGTARRWYERVLEADPRNDDIASQLAALAAQRRTPMSVPAIPEPEPKPRPTPAIAAAAPALLDDELLADVARMVDPEVEAAPEVSIPETEPDAGPTAPWALLGAVDVPAVSEPTTDLPAPALEADVLDASPAPVVDRPFARTPAWTPTMSAFMQEQAALDAAARSADELEQVAEAAADAADPQASVDAGTLFPVIADEEPAPQLDDEPAAPIEAQAVVFAAEAMVDEPVAHDDAASSATALTQALDAFASWDVGAPPSPTSDDEAALDDAWAGASELESAGVAEATDATAAIDEAPFEAGFFVPEWPTDLSTIASRTPQEVVAVADVADEVVDEGADATIDDVASHAVVASDTPSAAMTEPPAVHTRTTTDPWISVVAANDASSDYTPIGSTPPSSMHTVESVVAAASSEQQVRRLDGLETMDDTMGIADEEAPLDIDALAPVSEVEHDDPAARAFAQADDEAEWPASEPAAPVAQGDEPIVTETMAELYLTQGLTDRAIGVYRALAADRPDDAALAARLATLEQSTAALAPVAERTAGEWLAALAARRVARRTPMQQKAIVPESAGDVGLTAIFGAPTMPTDERAAEVWSQAFSPMAQDEGSDLFATATSPVDEPVFASSATPHAPEPAVTSPTNGGFSFDQFFAPDRGTASPAAQTDGSSTPPPPAPAEDLARFADWLRGLSG